MVSQNLPAIGLNRDLCAFLDVVHRRTFIDPHARLLRGPCQPQSKVERMKMGGPHIQDAPLVIGRRADRLQGGTVQDLDLVIAIVVSQMVRIVCLLYTSPSPRD